MIKAVIADDSPFLRQVLAEYLEEHGIAVVAGAKNGKEAVSAVKQHLPDILILDCEMPVMTGLEALKIIMTECPLPVFMFSSFTREGATITIQALELGAVDFLLKPSGGAHSLESVGEELLAKIRSIVLKRKMKASAAPAAEADGEAKAPAEKSLIAKRNIDIIAMGSSTGGVQAAAEIIPHLPANTKPIVWVQHMPANFTKSFAERLNSISKMKVCEAKDGDLVETGTCYLAPGGFQMRIFRAGDRSRIKIGETEKYTGHCPSCNVLFDSVSNNYASNAMGVILTGMGDDGAEGLVKMHTKGSFVIGQNESSCVVYGMPRAAYQLGAVDLEVPLKNIAGTITAILGVAAENK